MLTGDGRPSVNASQDLDAAQLALRSLARNDPGAETCIRDFQSTRLSRSSFSTFQP